MSSTTSFLDTIFPPILLISDVLIYVPVRLAIIPLILSILSALMEVSVSFLFELSFVSSADSFTSAFFTSHFCASSFVIPSFSTYPSLLSRTFRTVSMFLSLLTVPDILESFSPIIFIPSAPYISPFLLLVSFITPSILWELASFPSSFISLSALSFPMFPVISPFALFIFFPLRFMFPDVLICPFSFAIRSPPTVMSLPLITPLVLSSFPDMFTPYSLGAPVVLAAAEVSSFCTSSFVSPSESIYPSLFTVSDVFTSIFPSLFNVPLLLSSFPPSTSVFTVEYISPLFSVSFDFILIFPSACISPLFLTSSPSALKDASPSVFSR